MLSFYHDKNVFREDDKEEEKKNQNPKTPPQNKTKHLKGKLSFQLKP